VAVPRRSASGEASRVDEDPFEKQMRLSYEVQVRASTAQRYGKPQALDQLEEWIKETPISYISHDNCPASGGGIERVFFAAGKQHDALKKKTMDTETLE
jgi:hypothetical protein